MTQDSDDEKEQKKPRSTDPKAKLSFNKEEAVRKKKKQEQRATQYKSLQTSTSNNLSTIGKTANPQITTPTPSAEKQAHPAQQTAPVPFRTRPKKPTDI